MKSEHFKRISIGVRALVERNGGSVACERGNWNVIFPDGTDVHTSSGHAWGNLSLTAYTMPSGDKVIYCSDSGMLEA